MADAGETVLRAGRLLVATPRLADPNFERTVVLVLDHDENGSLGVVLNRPSPVPVGEVLPAWSDLLVQPDVLFHGGPVGTDSALAVAEIPPVPDAEEPVGFRRLFDHVGIVDLDTPTELLDDVIVHMRVFAGYAGWGDGQLAAEIEEGSWYVVALDDEDIFAPSPEGLWSRVLRRQPGELAWVSTRPPDPTMN
ncbi:MAG TPA: YqgE/AlgH family protein [Nocardioidaceae bacterium]